MRFVRIPRRVVLGVRQTAKVKLLSLYEAMLGFAMLPIVPYINRPIRSKSSGQLSVQQFRYHARLEFLQISILSEAYILSPATCPRASQFAKGYKSLHDAPEVTGSITTSLQTVGYPRCANI
jgi:hypothetical protein